MSLVSMTQELALNTMRSMRGEQVNYEWDEPIVGATYIAPARFTYTTIATAGSLQKADTSGGPWTTVASLTPGTFTIDGSGWFRVIEADVSDSTFWNISVPVVNAVRTRGNWRTDEPAATRVAVSERIQHWIVAIDDVIHPNGETWREPQREDRIETIDGESFKVMPQTQDGPLWRWVDGAGKTHRRIFTRERSSS